MASIFQSKSQVRTAIIEVIAFFDLFEYPLTTYEIWDNLDKRAGLPEVIDILERETQASDKSGQAVIEQSDGFYFLLGRQDTITTRRKRYNYSARKIAIARRFTKAFRLLPFVRVVAIANSLGFYNLRDGSDIDFFIITAPRRLWLSRLYCTGLAKLLNARPNARTKQDKICLSFYISTEHLNILDLRLPEADPYFDYWRRGLFLLYNKNNSYELFLSANDSDRPSGTSIEKTSFFCLDMLERGAKRWQLKILPPELRSAMNNSDGVVISDTVLKLYQRDRRREFLEKYGKTLHEIFKEGA